MIKEFKEFVKRGNVMDLAVGVIVGGAFSSIVTSLVNNILTPILGIFLGGIDFSGLSINIKDATINYGLFIQSIIDFLIIAFCIFILIKVLNKLMSVGKKEMKEEAPKPPIKKEEVILLEEIRDLLSKKDTKAVKKTPKKRDSKEKAPK